MKKLLILGRFVKEYEPVRLAEEGRKLGYEVDIVKYGQIVIEVNDGGVMIDLGNGNSLEDYDRIVMRAASKKGSSMVGIKTAVGEYLEKKGMTDRVLNGVSFRDYPLLGKVEQGLLMAQTGLPAVPMITFGSKLGWKKYLGGELKLPVMVKGRFGSHGRAVQVVKTEAELERLMNEYSEGNVLIQPVMKINKWFRCIVVNGKYLGQMRHTQKEQYRIAEGEIKTVIPEERMEELKQICLKATALFNADYAGIDVGWDEEKQNWVIFEVNRTAQFKYFEKRVMMNVALELVNSDRI
jgi:glutathione synthase/RimK-type ligase-like ATP-grasp enzyme